MTSSSDHLGLFPVPQLAGKSWVPQTSTCQPNPPAEMHMVEKPQALDVCGQRQWCRCFKSRPNANVAKSLTWAKTFQSLLFTGSSDSNVTFERYDRATLRMMAGGDAFASVKWRYTQVVVCLLLHEDWFIMIRAWWEGPSVDTAPAIYYSIALLLRRFC